jgi:hypothetical protein
MGHSRFFTAWPAVPVAKVAVRNEGTGSARNTSTDDAGIYTVSNIPARTYTPLSIRSKIKGKNTKNSGFPLVNAIKLTQEKTNI